jgi:ADP-heptose:LPS heptosyltransferase
MSNSPRILVIRNDKLGDFMLALPSFALLKQALPEARVLALVPAYTRELAEACPWIDEVVVDPDRTGGWASGVALARQLRGYGFDAAITLYSTARVGLAAWLAGIPVRLAPATKLAQVFYNRRLVQRRSRSEMPEWAYNLQLVRRFLQERGIERPNPPPPFLQFEAARVAALRDAFCREHGLNPARRLVFLHPGSGGSANNLSLDQYARLAAGLTSADGHGIVITAGPGEAEKAQRLAARLDGIEHCVYRSQDGLRAFAEHIQFADLFISGSTGPLHIAGALDRPTAAFYPRKRSSTALRWQTLNRAERRLAFSAHAGAAEEEMGSIDAEEAARRISERFLR